MRQAFELEGGRLHDRTPDSGPITIFAAPTPAERQLLRDALGIDDHTLRSALDPEEIPRLEFDPATDRTTIICKRPDPRADRDAARFEVASVGLFLDPARLTVVVADGGLPVSLDTLAVGSPTGITLRILRATVEEFVARLRAIRRTSGEIQARLNRSLDNRELVRMFDLSEDLLYYVDAIEANGAVLARLRALGERIGLTQDDLTTVDDLIIDNEQCARQGQVYSRVLGGLLDARGNIVNNNMNVLIKNLTVVNVVFLPLAVIAGMGGMSEFTMVLDHYSIDWRLGYPLFGLTMVLGGIGLWAIIRAWINRRMGNGTTVAPASR